MNFGVLTSYITLEIKKVASISWKHCEYFISSIVPLSAVLATT